MAPIRDFLIHRPRYQKRIITLCFDIFCVWLSLFAAISFRLGEFEWVNSDNVWHLLIIAPLTAIPFFIKMGLYRAVLRYISSIAIATIMKAVVFSTIALIVADAILLTELNLPRSIPFLYCFNLTVFMIGSRYFMQSWLLGLNFSTTMNQIVSIKPMRSDSLGRRSIIYGSGKAITELIQVLDRNRDYNPVAIVDLADDSAGGELYGRPIYTPNEITEIIKKHEPEVVLLAIPRLKKSDRRNIITSLEKYPLTIKTIPNWEDIYSGRMTIQEVQEIDLADILSRGEVTPDINLMKKHITEKVILISGAGGSIGSEITRQCLKLEPDTLILLDHSEYNLYQIEEETKISIGKLGLSIKLIPILGDVSDEKRMLDLMNSYHVNTIYHAAAYKHVPIVEQNISQGVKNNVFGTLSIAEAAIKAKVSNFVLISTDKAVRPSNVMGATKRIAEMILQAFSASPNLQLVHEGTLTNFPNETNFTMVRFGNVLGSSGSAIPLFREQIKQGGPVTVTHPEITRYFMSITEASQLVIQAGTMGTGGDVFVLDMGEPVKIHELVKRMVNLAGLSVVDEKNPEGDIEIVFTGLRPGEKLYEELLIGDNPEKTEHEKIFKANEDMIEIDELRTILNNISDHIEKHAYNDVKDILEKTVSGYKPDSKGRDLLEVV